MMAQELRCQREPYGPTVCIAYRPYTEAVLHPYRPLRYGLRNAAPANLNCFGFMSSRVRPRVSKKIEGADRREGGNPTSNNRSNIPIRPNPMDRDGEEPFLSGLLHVSMKLCTALAIRTNPVCVFLSTCKSEVLHWAMSCHGLLDS